MTGHAGWRCQRMGTSSWEAMEASFVLRREDDIQNA